MTFASAGEPPGAVPAPRCPKHPDKTALVNCQRCHRPVCPSCQVPAAVGVHCVDCVKAARSAAPALRSAVGAPVSRGLPVVTITIIVINVLVFLGQVATSGALTAQGMLFPAAAWSQPWRLVTAGFMHGSVVHLALNMYALWVVGSLVEQVLGRSRMAVAYMASVLGGHVMVLVWFRLFEYSYAGAVHAVIGASGGVFGLFAATLVLSRRLGGDVRGISMVIGLNLVISLVVAQISWQGHVGGLLAGAAAAAAYAYAPAAKRQLVAWLVGGGAAALTCGAVLATVSPWVNIWQF